MDVETALLLTVALIALVFDGVDIAVKIKGWLKRGE